MGNKCTLPKLHMTDVCFDYVELNHVQGVSSYGDKMIDGYFLTEALAERVIARLEQDAESGWKSPRKGFVAEARAILAEMTGGK